LLPLAGGDGDRKPLDPPGGQMREDTMKSRLLLLTGIVALAFVGPINASAATIDIADFTEVNDPSFTQSGFTLFNTIARVQEAGGIDGVLALSGTYIAANPLAAGVVQTFGFNMNDPVEDGPICCSDTLSITLIGAPGGPGGANMATIVTFISGSERQVSPLAGGLASPELVTFSAEGLTVTANSVPGPIVGAGLPGLIAACGALLILARRRRQLVA
jgi:hypothetical protein